MSEPDDHLERATRLLAEIADCARVEAAAFARKAELTRKYQNLRYDHADPDHAYHEHERAAARRAVHSRRLPKSMGQQKATLTATESTEVGDRLAAVVKTLCTADPREIQQRRADAYMALMASDHHRSNKTRRPHGASTDVGHAATRWPTAAACSYRPLHRTGR